MDPAKYTNLKFNAKPSKLFVILLVNFFFTIITLGLYYPWAKAKLLQYFYSETEFHGSRFVFHGKGKEMFNAYIKVYGLFIVLLGSIKIFELLGDPIMVIIATGVFYLIILVLIPLAIHGLLRYRLSRTSWRGIHMGYRGSLSKLYKIYLIGILFTILTLGIYYAWMNVSIRKYVMANIRFGSLEFEFNGKGGTLFLKYVFIVLSVLIPPVFLIYLSWFIVSIMNFKINNTVVKQDGELYLIQSTMKGGNYLWLKIVNFFIMVFTFGLGMPFVIIRNMKYELSNMYFSNKINMNAITQSEADYKDATGEDLSDALDLNIF